MVDAFVGKWNLTASENFDEFMKACGVGMLIRKTAATLKPSQVFSVEGDTITLKTISTFKSTEVNFKLGEEFDETTGDGRKMKTTYRMEGGKLICEQKPVKESDCPSTHTREILPDGSMQMTLVAKDVVSKRTYNK